MTEYQDWITKDDYQNKPVIQKELETLISLSLSLIGLIAKFIDSLCTKQSGAGVISA